MIEQIIVLRRNLENETGYPPTQHSGQRIYGPPPDWVGPRPERGSEVFIGKLPRDIFEDELVPVFSTAGKIYQMRLMMNYSGSNRGYAFVSYCNKNEASRAVKELNGYEIRPGRNIGVVKSVDNCRLFIGGIPKTKTKDEVHKELAKMVYGIVDVILYYDCLHCTPNRGYAFVEFFSHTMAALALRELVPRFVLWDEVVKVDWANPEPEIDDERMKRVKVLHVRNFSARTVPETIKSVFEAAISNKIVRVKKIYDYAFVHFFEREHAELAMTKLQNTQIDGINVEIRWAKPVVPQVYSMQKKFRGNAKFNNTFSLTRSMWLNQPTVKKDYYTLPPANLEAM